MIELKTENCEGCEIYRIILNGKKVTIGVNTLLDYVLIHISATEFKDISISDGKNFNIKKHDSGLIEIIKKKKKKKKKKQNKLNPKPF